MVKSSLTPSFQEVINKTVDNAIDIEDEEISSVEKAEIVATPLPEIDEKEVEQKTDEPKNEFSLASLFNNIGKDELLLIALIILFASDSSFSSYDTVIILALLLLYH